MPPITPIIYLRYAERRHYLFLPLYIALIFVDAYDATSFDIYAFISHGLLSLHDEAYLSYDTPFLSLLSLFFFFICLYSFVTADFRRYFIILFFFHKSACCYFSIFPFLTCSFTFFIYARRRLFFIAAA